MVALSERPRNDTPRGDNRWSQHITEDPHGHELLRHHEWGRAAIGDDRMITAEFAAWLRTTVWEHDRVPPGPAPDLPRWAIPHRIPGNTSPGPCAALTLPLSIRGRYAWDPDGPGDDPAALDDVNDRWAPAAYLMGARTLAGYQAPHRMVLAVGLRALAGRVCALAVTGAMTGPDPDDPEDVPAAAATRQLTDAIWPHGRCMVDPRIAFQPAAELRRIIGRGMLRRGDYLNEVVRVLCKVATGGSEVTQPALAHLFRESANVWRRHWRPYDLALLNALIRAVTDAEPHVEDGEELRAAERPVRAGAQGRAVTDRAIRD